MEKCGGIKQERIAEDCYRSARTDYRRCAEEQGLRRGNQGNRAEDLSREQYRGEQGRGKNHPDEGGDRQSPGRNETGNGGHPCQLVLALFPPESLSVHTAHTDRRASGG